MSFKTHETLHTFMKLHIWILQANWGHDDMNLTKCMCFVKEEVLVIGLLKEATWIIWFCHHNTHNLIHNLHCKNGSNPTTNKVFLHFWFEAILFVTHYITMKNCWIHFCISLNKRSGPQKILVLPFQQDYDDNISIESLEYAILWRNAYTQKL